MSDAAIPGLFEAVPDALLVVDGDGRVVRANKHAEVLFGHARGAMAGLEIEDLVPESARARHRAYRDRYMAAPHVRPMGATGQTLVGLRSDGSRFQIEIALSPLDSTDGKRFLASVRDISGSQRVQQALARARYDAIAARIGQLALQAAAESNLIEELPPLLAEALGVESVAIVSAAAGQQAAAVRGASGPGWHAGSTAPRPFAGQHREPWIIDDVAGDPSAAALFPLPLPPYGSAVLVPVFEHRRVSGALLAASREPRRFDHDACHLLQTAATTLSTYVQQRRAEEHLAHAQRLDAIGQLTGGVAHDFNNLLTVMSGSLQLLEPEVASADGQALLASALRSVGRGAELTAKLLAFARRQRLLPSAVDVPRLLHDLEHVLRRTLGDAVRLRVEADPGLPRAYVDAGQLEAALLNLALNARDALERGGEILFTATREHVGDEPAASTQASAELGAGDYLRLSVRDNGCGMAPDTLAHAMEPFFTTKSRERGSGLGLSMVYGFARQSGGGLAIDSVAGRGTEVLLFVPVAHDAAVDVPALTGDRGGGRGEVVLVVEDDPAVRDIAVAFLRGAGYRVQAVADGETALQVLRADASIALLFSDVMLGPGIDGKALAREALALRPQLAVLLTSGDEEHAAEAAGAEGLPLLRKPWRREQLAEAVRRELPAG